MDESDDKKAHNLSSSSTPNKASSSQNGAESGKAAAAAKARAKSAGKTGSGTGKAASRTGMRSDKDTANTKALARAKRPGTIAQTAKKTNKTLAKRPAQQGQKAKPASQAGKKAPAKKVPAKKTASQAAAKPSPTKAAASKASTAKPPTKAAAKQPKHATTSQAAAQPAGTAKASAPKHAAPTPATSKLDNARSRVHAARAWVVKNARTPKVIVPIALVAVYVLGGLFFSSHYLPGTTINGHDVSWCSANAATASAQNASKNYAATVKGDGMSLAIKAADIDLSFDADAYAHDATAHLPGWVWPFVALTNRDYDVTQGVSYDHTQLKDIVVSAVKSANDGATKSQNATLSYDESAGTFVVSKEQQGDWVSAKSALNSVAHGVQTLREQIELGADEFEHPSLVADDSKMKSAIRKANVLAQQSLELTIKGKVVHTVEDDLLRSWIALDDSYNLTGNLEVITDWARGDLSAEVDTVGTARTYTRTSDGKRIEVYGGGTYGWNMDGAALAKLICGHIAAGSTEPIEIPMQSTAEVYVHGKQDWGPRYVDVDLTEQYVIMFDEDSKIIMESECVTGDITQNNETVTGVFMIEKKESPAKLIGLDSNGDGEPDYENDVEYWMPFYGGYGLHDALWRDYFGSDLHQYGGGSHGCVNLPYYAAELLYENVKVGDVVVVHY